MKKTLKEFQEFAVKGNVIDLAIGVIMGAAFGPVVATLVNNVVMPPIGLLVGGIDFSSFAIPLTDAVSIKYGLFLNAVINFFITAAAVFFLVKIVNKTRKKLETEKPTTPPVPSTSEKLLAEIRDALVRQK